MSTFSLHPQLEKDCIYIKKLGLCHLLLLNNAYFKWFILVPEVEEEQVHLLSSEDRALLYTEAQKISEKLEAAYSPKRINIGAIGNMVPQLHFHVVARFEDDSAWPSVVWGHGKSKPYRDSEVKKILSEFENM